MNQAGDDKYYSSCAIEDCTCSSSVKLELSESNILEDFNDGKRNNCEPSLTDIIVHTNFENGRQDKLLLAETNSEDETPHEKELKVDAYRSEKDELDDDLEEGEIQDTPDAESVEAYCRFYQKGSCLYGKDCKFLHLSDKGLYNMLDFPSAVTKSVNCVNQFVSDQKCIYVPPAFDDPVSTWDRDLKEAMELLKESKRKVSLDRDKLIMTVQSGESKNIRPTATESPLNNRRCQPRVIKVRDSSCSEKVSSYAVMDTKLKSSGRDRPSGVTYRHDTRILKRSKTPNHMRWSPKSASCSSRSRSRSHSFCNHSSCSCSATSSPERGRRFKSSRVSKSYRKQCTSSSSESSSSYASKKAPRRTNSRSRGRSHLKKPVTSNYRSPFKILPREQKNARWQSSRNGIPHRPIQSKHPVTSKSVPLQSRSNNRSCSDMSISPLSDSLNPRDYRPGGRPAVCYFSDRHVSDMSISPLSDDSSFERFLDKAERIVPKVSKSRVKNMTMNTVRKRSQKGLETTKSCPSENTSREKSLFASSTASIPAARKQVEKSNPLLKDLMKFQGHIKRDCFKGGPRNVETKTPASTDVSKLAGCSAVGKTKQNTDVNERVSSFERFSGQTEGIVPKVSKSSLKNMSVDTVQKKTLKRVESTKSCASDNTSREIPLSASSAAPIPAVRSQVQKSNPLLKDLMKFHGCFKKGDSCKKPKNVLSKIPASTNASKRTVGLNKCNTVQKVKNTDVNESELSKTEILLRRLEEIKAAIERKKIFAPPNALKNT